MLSDQTNIKGVLLNESLKLYNKKQKRSTPEI